MTDQPLKAIPFAVDTPSPLTVGGALLAPMDYPTFRNQELSLIGLNLVVLGFLLLIDLSFWPYMGVPHAMLPPVLFALRFAEQCVEWWLLRRRTRPMGWLQVRLYAHLSIWISFCFAAAISLTSNFSDAHYAVLLVLPLIAAGFRFNLAGVLLAVGTAAALAYIEITVYFTRNPPFDPEEIFETTTMLLVFVVVGVMVWLVARRMRFDAHQLRKALDELNKTQEKLGEEERLAAIGRLASAVAHEIRNPVGMIASALETARRKENDQAIRREFCDIAAKESRRLERITTDFLAYARSKPLEVVTSSVETTLRYVASLVSPSLEARGQRLVLRVEGPEEVPLDPFQMHQALLNLMVNAIHHPPPGGRIILGSKPARGGVAFYVRNPGEPVGQPEAIFEPFFTTRARGTGLGLSISRKIARAHGGDLRLSENRAGCVRFTLTVPLHGREG